MKRKILSTFLCLCMVLTLLPVTALAEETNLPDWYFLFIFAPVDADYEEDGTAKHLTTAISSGERETLEQMVAIFGEVMTKSGIITPHIETLTLSKPITHLSPTTYGMYPNIGDIAADLENCQIDLDRYDHITVYARMDGIPRSYGGLTSPRTFDNGTTYSFIPADHVLERDWSQTPLHPGYELVHEFLHTMEFKVGNSFDLHAIEEEIGPAYQPDELYEACLLDIIRNCVQGEHGSGVHPAAWQYPPHVMRTMTELTIPSSVTSIGGSFYQGCAELTSMTLSPGNISIGDRAFWGMKKLTKVTIPVSMTSIGYAGFWDTGVKDVYYAGTEAQWKAIQVGEFNEALTNATIHCNHLMADVKTTDWFAQPVMWAVEQGVASGTGEGKFSPNNTCTQGQILTFLWRAYGSPKPSGAVTGSEYYAVPLQWAKEQKLVEESLSAKDPCTRADVVTYLWKLAGSPSAKAAGFSDVPASASYANAVNWAVEKKVTGGTSETTFSPEKTCTRGQIVTFLYAALGA